VSTKGYAPVKHAPNSPQLERRRGGIKGKRLNPISAVPVELKRKNRCREYFDGNFMYSQTSAKIVTPK
tara:strand:- start:76 stop:279 length:204 start_codon:yes stop_codon:yes gene_type:complete